MGEPDRDALRRQLLAWYRARKRDLPFRRTRDPYAILVAEIIMQRTRVRAGLPYYERFLAAFPNVRDLAAASEADVLRAWEGLGFYGRARNLHRAAKAIVEDFGGEVPRDYVSLRALPGIGDYTAGAVGSIAFGVRVPAVDGNVTRVLSRVFRIQGGGSHGPEKKQLRGLAAELVPATEPGEWNQALMELGATVCIPKVPRCSECPVVGECLAFASGIQNEIPRSAAKSPVRVAAVVFAVVRDGDSVLLVHRESGLHAGMYALPGGDVLDGESPPDAIRRHLTALGLTTLAVRRVAPVQHTFSHLRWEGAAYACRVRGTPRDAERISLDRLPGLPLVPLHRRLLSVT